ncbi:hypothetical protein [Isoptericola sp. NPDC057653]|uniref:hypothetical protein n=1 Tax=Isoptericola sp. NPDC057653 TaxID=3346195 RepID=UPI0036A17141
MSRRRSSMATFDLQPDEPETVDDAAEPEDVPPGAGERLVAAVRRVRPRTWGIVAGAVAGAVVLTVGGTAAGNALAERHRLDLLVAAPGGVRDAAAAVADEGWSADTDSGVLAVLAGGVVVAQDGTDAVGLDAATGDEAWREPLGEQVECGPGPVDPVEWTMPLDEVVCLSGDLTDRAVSVIAADGTVVGTRGLGDVSGVTVAPAAGGTVLVVEPDGPLPEARGFADEDAALRALETLDGPGLRVRVEDALSGDVRATVDVPFDPAATDQCLLWMNDTIELDFAGYGLRSSPGLVELGRCGAHLVWTPPGAGETAPVVGAPGNGEAVLRSVDGGVAVPQEDGRSRLTALDGPDVVLPGVLLDPAATDGSAGPRLVLTADGLTALDPAALGGDPLWVRPRQGGPVPEEEPGLLDDGSEVLVRTAGTVLLQQPDGVLVGLDAGTGAERWSVGEPVPGWQDDRWLQGALTDGREALLTVAGDDDGYALVRLDLATGRVLQEDSRAERLGERPAALGGILLLRTTEGDGASYVSEDGITVHRDPGSLRGAGRA